MRGHKCHRKNTNSRRAKPVDGLANTPTVFIGGISLDSTPDRLREYLETFGPVGSLDLARDKRTNTLKGFAKVKMATSDGL